jgi:hypothetical protein
MAGAMLWRDDLGMPLPANLHELDADMRTCLPGSARAQPPTKKSKTMPDFSQQHRRWVANFISGKIEELRFHLGCIVNACDETFRLFNDQKPTANEISQAVVYGFSAMANGVQTLKDSMQTATGNELPWSNIKPLRHGAFMYGARNAVTHDGNPVISAWADGRYFVPAKICRIGDKGQLISIPAPSTDVRTVCLEFAEDFGRLLRQTLLDAHAQPALQGAPFSIEELDSAWGESNVIPDFARESFLKNRDEIAAKLQAVEHDPVAQAVKHLDDLIAYCDSAQKNDQTEQP